MRNDLLIQQMREANNSKIKLVTTSSYIYFCYVLDIDETYVKLKLDGVDKSVVIKIENIMEVTIL